MYFTVKDKSHTDIQNLLILRKGYNAEDSMAQDIILFLTGLRILQKFFP